MRDADFRNGLVSRGRVDRRARRACRRFKLSVPFGRTVKGGER